MNLSTVAKYIRRSPYQAISAGLIMTLTFFVISVFAVLTVLSIRMISYFESRPQLTIFFTEEATQEEVENLSSQIEATGKTSSVTFVSKEEALQIYQEQNKEDPILLDLVTSDILPASLEVQATQAEFLSELAEVVSGSEIVEEVIFQKDIVDTLISWINAFRIVGISVIGVLITVSVFVVITIIGIKIAMRREEIETMRLIGASNWFIRAPFLFEGIFYGLAGALLGWALAMGILLWGTPTIEQFLRTIPIFPIEPLLLIEILAVEILFATILGMFASYVAVLRYLK